MSGECVMCGECCKYIPLPLGNIRRDKDTIEYYLTRGILVDAKQGFLLIPSRCQHLTEDNKCDIHETKPKVCKHYHGKKMGLKRLSMYYVPPGCAMK